ncbi:MAG: acyltransferase [Clostridia bacterium]|nr:acyltransferase [Clostridia bacterium]
MSIQNLLAFRGLFAITILLHHLSASFVPAYALGLFTHIGYLFVALFFFLSGYGLMFSFNKNRNYIRLKTFILKRFFNTLLPYWLCVILTALICMTFFTPVAPKRLLISFISPTSIVLNAWYVFEIVILYAVFAVLFRLKNIKSSLFLMLLFVVALTAFFLARRSSIWARSLPAFYLGIAYCHYREKADRFIKKSFYLKASAVFVLFAFFCVCRYFFVKKGSYWADNIFAILSSSLFSVLFFGFLIKKIKLGNPVLNFSGKISYEIYLMHGYFCKLLYTYNHNIFVYTLIIFSCTIVSSLIIHTVSTFIRRIFTKNEKT